jgi:hypothetical protein
VSGIMLKLVYRDRVAPDCRSILLFELSIVDLVSSSKLHTLKNYAISSTGRRRENCPSFYAIWLEGAGAQAELVG